MKKEVTHLLEFLMLATSSIATEHILSSEESPCNKTTNDNLKQTAMSEVPWGVHMTPMGVSGLSTVESV